MFCIELCVRTRVNHAVILRKHAIFMSIFMSKETCLQLQNCLKKSQLENAEEIQQNLTN